MSDDFDFDDDSNWNDDALQELDAIETAIQSGSRLPPKSIINPNLKQRDLFGGTVAPAPARATSTSNVQGGGKVTTAKVRAVKRWDPASFARHGWSKRQAAEKKAKAKGKGKGKAHASDEEAWDDDDVVDDDDDDDEDGFLDPSYDPTVPLPIKWEPDPLTSKTWQYPVQADKPLRTYQYNIVFQSLFENTLVSLPTGLGKTFIAACVM